MDPSKKSTSRATVAATSKGKSAAAGGTGTVNPSILSDVHVKEVDGKLSPPAIMPKVGMNQPEVQHLTKGQLLQMLTNLQKQLKEQQHSLDGS